MRPDGALIDKDVGPVRQTKMGAQQIVPRRVV